MAGDIKKQLVIKATLDSAALKKEIANLKNELKSGFSLSSQDTTSIKSEFKNIAKSFAEELKKSMQSVDLGSAGKGRKGGRRNTMFGEELKLQKAEERAIAKVEMRELAKEEKLFKVQERDRAKLEAQKEKDRKKDLDQNVKNLEAIRQKRAAVFTENSRLDRTMTATTGRALGMSADRARDMARKVDGVDSRQVISGMGATGAAVTGAAFGQLQLRRMMVEREQRFAQDIESGDFIGAQARQAGRDETSLTKLGGAGGGALAGAALGAKMGAFGGVPGMLIGGAIGGIAGGVGGYMAGSNMQGEFRSEQVAPLARSFGVAKGLNPARLNALQGGGVSSQDLTNLQLRGTRNAFSPEETLNQLTQARGFLGNAGAANNLSGMQDVTRATGMDVGSQASVIETLTGAGSRGGSFSRASTQQTQIIEKAISAGLDRSKTSQFMRTTAELIQSSAGFGRVNTEGMANRMTDFAQGFAGGGPITSTAMQQAQSLSQLTKSESTSKGGFSGIGNITALQDTFGAGLTSDQMIAGRNISSDATVEDVQQILGVSREKAEQFLKRKQDTMGAGMKAAGINPGSTLGIGLGAEERGITAESNLGILNAKGAGSAKLGANLSIEAMRGEVVGSKEGQMAKVESRINQERFEQGFSAFDAGIKGASDGLVKLTEAFQTSSQVFYKLIEQSSKANLTKGDVK